MKITAEFNSVEEVLSFANLFGKATPTAKEIVVQVSRVNPKEIANEIKEMRAKSIKPIDEAPVISGGTITDEQPKSEAVADTESIQEEQPPKEEKKEDPKVTKEMVRERLGAIMKAGKQKEVKELVAQYGASKVPDLKEEDYAAVYKEAEALM
ncbi:MAG: hypothetical protein Q8933_09440 [Bacteroidota bacterium]|nr:hypothetical protein [Bacteroidota bacterium]